MDHPHPQESLLHSLIYRGVPVDIVSWTDTVWCGKMGYASAAGAEEPDVERLMAQYLSLDHASAAQSEAGWSVCISVNYLCPSRPRGVFFGSLAATENQPQGFDLYHVPAAQYMRIRITGETAQALGRPPWQGGIPPYHWIGEQIAPALGYTYGDDTLPIFEYYGFYCPETGAHEFCYLYVPVKRLK